MEIDFYSKSESYRLKDATFDQVKNWAEGAVADSMHDLGQGWIISLIQEENEGAYTVVLLWEKIPSKNPIKSLIVHQPKYVEDYRIEPQT